MTTVTKAEHTEAALERLREWLKPGDTVHTILRHVSRSGMQRTIQLVKLGNDGDVAYLGYNAHLAGVGSGYDNKREGIKVSGCGMDMGFALVYELSYALFGQGYECLGDQCLSADHTNRPSERVICSRCDGEGTQAGDDNKVCPACRGYGSSLVYGPENPRGPGVVHKDGYALRHRWL